MNVQFSVLVCALGSVAGGETGCSFFKRNPPPKRAHRRLDMGMVKLNHHKTAGFSSFHVPGSHLGYQFFLHSHKVWNGAGRQDEGNCRTGPAGVGQGWRPGRSKRKKQTPQIEWGGGGCEIWESFAVSPQGGTFASTRCNFMRLQVGDIDPSLENMSGIGGCKRRHI